MQKTFNVWVKKFAKADFNICSQMVEIYNKMEHIDKDNAAIDDAAGIYGCDVSQWLESLAMKEGEVKSFKLTLKEN